MRKILFLSFFLFACGTGKEISNTQHPEITEQIFLSNQTDGLPGKCYQEMELKNEMVWTEVLCQNQITKRIIKQVQEYLTRLNYEIDDSELSEIYLGPSTKHAILDFQSKNNMAYGGIDWATINKLKNSR